MGVLDGKSAIVTGSARGIGRATAELLVAQGAQVLINDLDGDVAEQASSEISGETAVFAGDLTKPGVPDQLVQKAIDSFGKIDIIVNNAGYTLDAPIHKMSDEHFQAMLDIHTVVPFRVIRAAAPHLREPAKKEKEEGKEVRRGLDPSDTRKVTRALSSSWVITFPQGTTKPFAPGRKGTALIIKQNKPIVIPVVISGFWRAFDKKGLRIKKKGTQLSVTFKPPMNIDYEASLDEILEQVMDEIGQSKKFMMMGAHHWSKLETDKVLAASKEQNPDNGPSPVMSKLP